MVFYRNPTPVTLTVVKHEEQLLLVRRALSPLKDYWAPPGGYVECGESLTEAAIREVREETGLDVEIDGLIDVFSQADVDVIIIAFRAHSVEGHPVAADDASELSLFKQGELPLEPAPKNGTSTDKWFYKVIREATATWR
ncbi:MAG: NUDIX hydrolase [Sulfuritalea sp.]|nr:NUDIX hydrolase [Sulfuritalea sp.]